MYYFAYGSNMNRRQMSERCKTSVFLVRASLQNFRFVFDGRSRKWKAAVANVVGLDSAHVWGGLYEITQGDLDELDAYEGYPSSYDRKILAVKDDAGRTYEAWVYLRKPLKEGLPDPDYKNLITVGAHDCGLPEDYIRQTFGDS